VVGASPQNTARATTALSIFFVLFASCTEVGAELRYEAVRDVIDGDISVLQSGERVRLAGINTPELRRDEQLPEPLARYGRTLAYLYNSAGQSLQRQLLLKGLAGVVAISPNLRRLTCYT